MRRLLLTGNSAGSYDHAAAWFPVPAFPQLESGRSVRRGYPAMTEGIYASACPLCRKKYGNTGGKRQEAEGISLAEEFLRDSGISKDVRERAVFLINDGQIEDLSLQWSRLAVMGIYCASEARASFLPGDMV